MSQLVFKIMKPGISFHGVDYNERKQENGQASLIHIQNFGHLQDGRTQILRQDIKKYLSYYSQRNVRTKSPQFHAILSCKGQSLSSDQLKDHAIKLMKQMGYGDNPLLIYSHTDTENNHIHIISSRIDPNGRKIPDAYEGLKANRLLSAMLQLDTQYNYKQALKEALEFRFSSVAQFILLLERKGYNCRQQQHQITFYKHGTKQGSLPLSILNERIEAYNIVTGELSRIKALVLKYQQTHERALQKTGNGYPSASSPLASTLTTFLHHHFGLEFVFFTGKKHDKPYGYAIIDHMHKTIYKGGDVLNLSQLTGLSDHQKLMVLGENDNNRIKGREDEQPKRICPSKDSNDMVNLIQNLEYQVEQDLKQEGINSKKKKRRDQRQIR